jgi:hypothetical protein
MTPDSYNFISQIQAAVAELVADGDSLDPDSDEGQFMRLLEEIKSVRGIQVWSVGEGREARVLILSNAPSCLPEWRSSCLSCGADLKGRMDV